MRWCLECHNGAGELPFVRPEVFNAFYQPPSDHWLSPPAYEGIKVQKLTELHDVVTVKTNRVRALLGTHEEN